MTDVPGVRFRTATEADDLAIRSLLARSYADNVKSAAPFTRWQYWANPFGDAVAVVAVHGEQVVAHWAAVGVPLRMAGARVPGAKGVDIATDPDWRGRGLFSEVGARLMRACREAGIRAVLSHPNPGSARGVARAGGAPVGRVAAYVHPLDDAWVASRFHVPIVMARSLRARLFRVAKGDPAQVVPAVPADIDGLWLRAGEPVRNGVIRDDAWWQWRYVQRPARPYTFVTVRRSGRLTGAAALTVADRFGGRFGLVLEYLAIDREAAAGLTTGLAEAAADRGAVGLAQVAIPSSSAGRLAAAAGFVRLPRLLEPRPLRFLVTDPGGDSGALTRQPWSMHWGDLDHL